MGQAQRKQENLTITEYLAIEREDNVRYEYHHGEIFAMAGGTIAHTRIVETFIAN